MLTVSLLFLLKDREKGKRVAEGEEKAKMRKTERRDVRTRTWGREDART